MAAKVFVRLAVFAGSVALGLAGLRLFEGDSLAALLMGVCCTVVAVCGLAVSVLGIPVFGVRQPDSGFGIFSDPTPRRRRPGKPRQK